MLQPGQRSSQGAEQGSVTGANVSLCHTKSLKLNTLSTSYPFTVHRLRFDLALAPCTVLARCSTLRALFWLVVPSFPAPVPVALAPLFRLVARVALVPVLGCLLHVLWAWKSPRWVLSRAGGVVGRGYALACLTKSMAAWACSSYRRGCWECLLADSRPASVRAMAARSNWSTRK